MTGALGAGAGLALATLPIRPAVKVVAAKAAAAKSFLFIEIIPFQNVTDHPWGFFP